ncbi:MAG: RagB/SusD family nutrient uptake outer membrane protein [Tannerella sp.]|jgi:hypothetical protein|nr:RagB/SusD family nutrient uptake outer membrane protein [Tannerella sp.]
MKKINFAGCLLFALALASCTGDLDQFPKNTETSQTVYSTFEGTEEALAKIYGAYTLSGQTGPSGNPDISGLDEGSNGDFLRCYFNHQEMPTDEAHCIWNDSGVSELNSINFTSDGNFTVGLYDKCIMQVMYANEFLKNTANAGNGFSSDQQTQVKAFRAEARFLRAYAYWVLLDVFGNPPFVTETSDLGTLPPQIQRADLFKYIESELLDLDKSPDMIDARKNVYGRADKGAVDALLARLYLNAEVYTGTPRWNDAATYAEKVIKDGYSLEKNYADLFLADNNVDNNETILSINYDGKNTRSYGGTTFLINCSSNADYQTKYAPTLISYGIFSNACWGGYRARKEFYEKFEAGDKRNLFVGENEAIGDHPSDYTYGMATYKWRNITSKATVAKPLYGSDVTYADTDFPLFRLAEMYLIYAEAVVRGATTGSMGQAINYVNLLRERAFGDTKHNVSSLDLDFILDERARELYWECQRRTDLIRYGYFTTSKYIWEWKGGVENGRQVDSHYRLYPLPSSDVTANMNLKQNPGY